MNSSKKQALKIRKGVSHSNPQIRASINMNRTGNLGHPSIRNFGGAARQVRGMFKNSNKTHTLLSPNGGIQARNFSGVNWPCSLATHFDSSRFSKISTTKKTASSPSRQMQALSRARPFGLKRSISQAAQYQVNLSPEQKQFFHDKGFLVLESMVDNSQLASLKAHGRHLIEQFVDAAANDPTNHTTFSTTKQTSNQYFLDSANNVSFFWEPLAFDANNRLIATTDKYNTINKIGHNLHEVDPVFSPFCMSKKWADLAQQLGISHPLIVQSMYIVKGPKLGGEVRPHQDSSFIHTKPFSCTAFWFPLVDVSTENACLWVAPGSHKHGIYQRYRITSDRANTEMTPPDEDEKAPWEDPEIEYSKSKFPEKWTPVEVKRGSLVMMHGSLLHLSEQNFSNKPRDVMSFHLIDKNCEWSADNWIQKKSSEFKEFSSQ